ncbi:AarF/ABC1/UbiB kinase family protein [Myxococcota bacterium]|nr:AarF/ABC1/UbiB kinase family protein [Myxococcota bacterium]
MTDGGLRRSITARSSRILGIATRLAGHEARNALAKRVASTIEDAASSELKTRIAQAKVLAEGLSQLKGAAMKAGQLLSIDASDLLPPEALEILGKLQGKAEPIDFEVIRSILEAELGAERLARLERLDPIAAAAASIGQVHTAHVDGTRVAVKVQYPGIAESIDSDIALLEKLAASWIAFTRGKFELEEVFEELRITLHLEADYARERAMLEEYAALVAPDPRFVVPRAFAELSSARVLTMTWEHGVPLGAWALADPPRAEREHFARAVLDLYCREFFDWGFVQTDPNPANFLVRPETRQLVLLDFGATLRYDAAFRATYVELLRAVDRRDHRAIVDVGVDFGLIDARERASTKEAFVAMLESAAEPFRPHLQPFAFRDPDYAERSRRVLTTFVRALEYSPPPRRLIFLHRKLGGIHQLLRKLDVRLDLRPYWERMVTRAPRAGGGAGGRSEPARAVYAAG